MEFQYEAWDHLGKKVTGEIASASANEAAATLVRQQLTPTHITTVTKKSGSFWQQDVSYWFAQNRVKSTELIFLCQQLYALIKSGVPIAMALSRIIETDYSACMKKTLQLIVESLLSGENLSTAFGKHPNIFSNMFVNLLRAGEKSGRLEETFLYLSRHYQLEQRTQARLKAASRYPIAVLVSVVSAVVLISFFVVPTFSRLFKQFHLPLPWQTRLLIETSDFMRHYWIGLLCLSLAIAVILWRYAKSERGGYVMSRIKLQLPVIGSLLNRIILSRFARTLAMLFKAGIPVLEAIPLVAGALDNRYLAKHVLEMKTAVEQGESVLQAAKESRLFSPLILQMLAVGEETGRFDDMLYEAANFYESEVDYDIARISELIQPILILALGILVLILALGVFLPMWDMVKLARLR